MLESKEEYQGKVHHIEKIMEGLVECKVDDGDIRKQVKQIEDRLKMVKVELENGNSEQIIGKCQQIVKECDQIEDRADHLVSSLKRLRFKLGQADIPELIKTKKHNLSFLASSL